MSRALPPVVPGGFLPGDPRRTRVRRTVGWMVLCGFLLGTAGAVYVVIERLVRSGPDMLYDRLLLHLLILAIVVLALGLAGVLVRNLVRLIVDRKHGLLGSKLRTKLVFFFLALVLVPALVLFYGSTAVIRMTVDAMLKPPVEETLQHARIAAEELQGLLSTEAARAAEWTAAEVASAPAADPSALRGFLDTAARREGLVIAALLDASGALLAESEPAGETSVLREQCLRAAREMSPQIAAGRPSTVAVDQEDGLLVVAMAPLPAHSGATQAVVAGMFLGRSDAVRGLSSTETAYRRLRDQRRDLIRFYLSLIGLIFLVTVFVATWIGFYLSRRMTVPIQELASASREISSGNLGVRVRAQVGDELGVLVDAFNEMAARLQESQEVITRSTADLRSTNQALEERRRYIETLIEDLSTAVMSVDRFGRVTTANPAVQRILGVRPAPGDDLREVLVAQGLEPLVVLLDQVRAGGADARSEMTLLSPDRGTLTVSVQVSPLRGGRSEPLGTLIMVEDLTDLLRAQRIAAWREVARRLAHEIKNPLTPIQLAAQRLRRKWQQESPDLGPVLSECTESIEREVGSLKRLVDEFSRFARLPETAPVMVEFGPIMESVLALYRGLPGIVWEIERDPSTGPVKLDAAQIRRALINLIDNAVAAMNGTGTVRIASGPWIGPGRLRIEVSDTGPGIPAGDRDRLFLPYFSTKRRGTGLGLAIVHRVVTDHHGRIRVEDNRPRGARFVIEIPA